MKTKIFLSVILTMVFSISSLAEEVDWTFDPYQYEYDMTVYVGMNADGNQNVDMTDYTIGVFLGDECRGIVEVKNVNGHTYGYLRARSSTPGAPTFPTEELTFKVVKNSTQRTAKCEAKVTFKPGDVLGMPSSPIMIDVTNLYKVTFMVNNEVYDEKELYYGESYSAPADPSVSGATFNGWSPSVPADATMPDHDVEYVAQLTWYSTVEAVFANEKEAVKVYSLSGKFIKTCSSAEEMNRLPKGLYVVKGETVLVRY